MGKRDKLRRGREKAQEMMHQAGVFLGVAYDDKLINALPNMEQADLERQIKMAYFRIGSAVVGSGFHGLSMLVFPGSVASAALNLRQLRVASKTKGNIMEALQDKAGSSVGHVKGSRRYFLTGALLKGTLTVAFLGSIGAQSFIINHLNHVPLDIIHALPQDQPLEAIVHEVFSLPHEFNAIPAVEALHGTGKMPEQKLMEVLGVQAWETWATCEGADQVMLQVGAGVACEANVPAAIADKLMEGVAYEWNQREDSAAGSKSRNGVEPEVEVEDLIRRINSAGGSTYFHQL